MIRMDPARVHQALSLLYDTNQYLNPVATNPLDVRICPPLCIGKYLRVCFSSPHLQDIEIVKP